MSIRLMISFQPTRPLRGATGLVHRLSTFDKISTHAPLAGRDRVDDSFRDDLFEFQPTRPLRGATDLRAAYVPEEAISTHAPLAGRD